MVISAGDGTQASQIREISGAKQNTALSLEILCKLPFYGSMRHEGSREHTRGTGAESVTLDGQLNGADDIRVGTEIEVVVRGKTDRHHLSQMSSSQQGVPSKFLGLQSSPIQKFSCAHNVCPDEPFARN